MSKSPIVIYHANCPDGFTAAWIARKALGPDCEFIPAHYGHEPPDCTGRSVYILDFSYKRPVMRQIASQAMKLVVLDHHKTAESELAGFTDEFCMRPDLIANPPGSELPLIWFDMSKSGAMLAWEHFIGTQPPWIVKYVQDRDLWQWKLRSSREVNAALASYERTFEQWDVFETEDWVLPQLITEGVAIERFKNRQIDDACRNATEIELAGHKIMAVNSTVNFSEVAGKLAEDRPFGVAWFYRQDGQKQWSLRSRDGGVDVSEIAKKFGGGGHRNAAGFEGEIHPS